MGNQLYIEGENVWCVLTNYSSSGKFASARHRYVSLEIFCCVVDALVAQSVEHHHGKVGVNGSNPFEGSFISHS